MDDPRRAGLALQSFEFVARRLGATESPDLDSVDPPHSVRWSTLRHDLHRAVVRVVPRIRARGEIDDSEAGGRGDFQPLAVFETDSQQFAALRGAASHALKGRVGIGSLQRHQTGKRQQHGRPAVAQAEVALHLVPPRKSCISSVRRAWSSW